MVRVGGVGDESLPLARADVAAPRQQAVDQWPAHGCLFANRVELAEGELEALAGGERWAVGGDVDRADARVLAQQRALRATRHLQRVDVGEVEGRGQRVVGIAHAVDDQAHCGVLCFGLTLLADAADRQAAGALIAEIPLHITGALNQLADVAGIEPR